VTVILYYVTLSSRLSSPPPNPIDFNLSDARWARYEQGFRSFRTQAAKSPIVFALATATDATIRRKGLIMQTMTAEQSTSIPEDLLFIDRYGVTRIKEPVLTIVQGEPVLLSFDDVRAQLSPGDDQSPELKALQLANLAVLERTMPKLYPYQGNERIGNRRLHPAKVHSILHRALWVRDIDRLAHDWADPRYKKYVTSKDLKFCPKLREMLADPDCQYRDPKAERSGFVTLRSVEMGKELSWSPEISAGVEAEKMVNRQTIAARMELVPWVEVPEKVDLVLLTDEEASRRFGQPVPDGMIPVTKGAVRHLKIESRNGHPVALKNGDKIRGAVLPFKGTVQKVPGNRPEIFLVEGGALKVAISDKTSRRIKVNQEQITDGAFAVETPSQERLIEAPRFSAHMLNLLVGQVRAKDPNAADVLVPRIPEHLIRLASGRGELIGYVGLCIHPVHGNKLDRRVALDVCEQILAGSLCVPIERGVVTVPGVNEDDSPYQFGITSAGRLLLRGVPPTYEAVWVQLEPRITAEIYKALYRHVSGVGGHAQADSDLGLGNVKISRKLGEHLKGATEASIMYWPSKFPHCLHRVSVEVDRKLDGSVIMVHPMILETLGGDCDGDLIYLITEPSIVSVSRPITDHVTITDRISGDVTEYENTVEMVRSERQVASKNLEVIRAYLQERPSHEPQDSHERIAEVNEGSKNIGLAFLSRDMAVDAVGWDDDRTYVRMGELCDVALAGLKSDSPTDVVKWVLADGERLSLYLSIPLKDLPYDADGTPIWHRSNRTKSMYHSLSNKRTPLSLLVGTAKAAKQDSDSLFEWILSRSGIDTIDMPKVITRDILRAKASDILGGVPADQIRSTRFHLARSRSMVCEADEHYVPIVGQEPVTLQDHRYGRVRYLLEHGVDPAVLRAVVMQKVSESSQSVEALGLLTALRSITRTSVSAEAAS
jgi:hypothetical protein